MSGESARRSGSAIALDHVEVFVPDREAAAAWYGEVFGLQRVAGTEAWAADPRGPLMISADGGTTMLALFERPGEPSPPPGGWHRVAFRLDGAAFLAFVERARELGLADERVGRLDLQDHDTAVSAYFADPWGHRLEVTTYDHATGRRALTD